MLRKETSVYIEERLLREVESLAARTGMEEREVFEEALRAYFVKAEEVRPPGKKIRGKYAHVPTSSEAFARRKQDEISFEGEQR